MRPRCVWLVWLLSIAALLIVLSFAAGAALSEGALHAPLGRWRGSDTAALAYSVAQSSGATAEKILLRGRDGVGLDAWWISPTHPSGRAVMICHGVADSAYGGLGFALLFLRNGYSVLVPESRGHGEGAGLITYGVLEADDTVRWLRRMNDHGATSVFGFGESLGGSILLESLSHGANFAALVVECPYSSFEAVADERVARFIPPLAANMLVKEGFLYTYLRYRVNLFDARPDLAIRHAHVPILLIHGLADKETTPAHSRRLARANPGCTELWLVPRARHTGAYATVPKEFETRVLRWFEQSG